jgi:hypothetical protein
VIQVAVGQNRRFDSIGGNSQAPVLPVRFGPAALEGSAVHQVTCAVNFKYVLGAGYFLIRIPFLPRDFRVFRGSFCILLKKPLDLSSNPWQHNKQ